MKILILRLSSMGDILLATPVLDVLKNKYPEGDIDWVVNSEFQDVLLTNPRINELIVINNKQQLKDIRKKIKGRGYDLIFDLHRNSVTYYLTRFYADVYRYSKRTVQRFFLVYFKKKYKNILPVTTMYFKALNKAGIRTPDEWQLRYGLLKSLQIRTINDYNLHNSSYIAIIPGASYPTKMWPKEYFKGLIEKLKINDRLNMKFVLLGRGKKESKIAEYISEGLESVCYNLCDKLDLQETATIIKFSELVITNDNGPMHLAECFNKKILAIFGCTTEEFGFFPYSTDHKIMQNNDLKCRPCTHFGRKKCPKKHFRCMRDISVEDVYDQAVGMLR